MKFFSNLRIGFLFVLLLACGGLRAEAGNTPTNSPGFGLTVTVSTNLYFINNTITTSITVSNGTGLVLDNVYVTNEFSEPVSFVGFTNFYTSTNNILTSSNAIVFDFSPMTNGDVAQVAFTWQTATAGLLANIIAVASDEVTNTTIQTNIFTVYSVAADLGVSLALVSQAYVTNDFWVITNDWVTYQVTVTNLGPGTVAGVLVTNALPPHVSLLSPGVPTVSNQWVFAAGTLAAGTGTNYQFTVLAATNGGYALAGSVGAPNLYDPYAPNNQNAIRLFATNYLATLQVATNSGQIVNLQNGLIEQTIVATNPGTNSAPAVRVVVGGLTNQLYNASGTNSRQPFVVDPATLAPAGQAGLRLQYNPRLPFPFTNGQLHAYAVPASTLYYTPKPSVSSTNFNYYRMSLLNGGAVVLLEFTNIGGPSATYTVVYQDNLHTNAMISLPPVSSQANRIQWLDYGPPATISAPNSVGSRLYQVMQNP